ncbi:MAG: thiamine/thiamine pyrophosphate ABC transporter permease ThiP [Pseudomonadota bacterium]
MVGGDEPLTAVTPIAKGLAWSVLAALAILCVTPLVALGSIAASSLNLQEAVAHLTDPVVLRALRFTLIQAGLSTILSIALAIPVLIALRQTQSAGVTRIVRSLFALPLVLPQLVAALAIVAVFGQNGWLSALMDQMELSWPSIYGLAGILLAHVFFNLPLAVRVFDQALQSLPPEYEKNAAQLGMYGLRRFMLIEGVVIKDAIGGVATLIFLLCATSFTIVLVLGGGPRSTTLEVAIYQALAFDFDLGRALFLIVLQIVVAGAVVLAFFRRAHTDLGSSGFSLSAHVDTRAAMAGVRSWRPGAVILLALGVLFVGLPFAAIAIDGVASNPLTVWFRPSVMSAVWTSVVIGLSSALLAVLAATLLSNAGSGRMSSVLPMLALIFPPIVLSAGWFLTIRQYADPFGFAAMLVIVINAAMALPFVLRIIDRAFATHRARHSALEAQLGMGGWARWRLSLLPSLRLPLIVGFAFAFALSLGDFGVVALFGSDGLQTLPYLIYASFGSYRTQDAAALALLLSLLVFLAIALADFAARQDRNDLGARS